MKLLTDKEIEKLCKGKRFDFLNEDNIPRDCAVKVAKLIRDECGKKLEDYLDKLDEQESEEKAERETYVFKVEGWESEDPEVFKNNIISESLYSAITDYWGNCAELTWDGLWYFLRGASYFEEEFINGLEALQDAVLDKIIEGKRDEVLRTDVLKFYKEQKL